MADQTPTRNFKFGWIPDLPDHRDIHYSAPVEVLRELPQKVDLRKSCPPVFDQGDLSSCTANAGATAFEFSQRKQQIPFFSPSRLFIYYNTRDAMGTVPEDSGASLREMVKSMNKLGVCAEDRWPYDIDRFTKKPSEKCYSLADTNQVLQYNRLDNTNLTELKVCLADGYPFVFGFTVWESFTRIGADGLMPMPQPSERYLGGHAVTAVGYDDVRQVFIIQNSYSGEWGHTGYFYMPYAFIGNTGFADDFWTIRLVEAGLKTVSLAYRVKQAMLLAKGNSTLDPSKLKDDYRVADFSYSDMQLVDLADRLTKIQREVQPGSKPISVTKISACETVSEVVGLVNS